MQDQEKLIDKETVKRRYCFRRSTLNWLIRTRQIPGIVRIRKGKGVLYFDPQEIDAWVQKNKLKYTQKGEST